MLNNIYKKTVINNVKYIIIIFTIKDIL